MTGFQMGETSRLRDMYTTVRADEALQTLPYMQGSNYWIDART